MTDRHTILSGHVSVLTLDSHLALLTTNLAFIYCINPKSNVLCNYVNEALMHYSYGYLCIYDMVV